MAWIRASVAVLEQAVRAHLVLVGTVLALDHWDRGDAQRRIWEGGRLEDALRPHEGHPLVLEGETSSQEVDGQDFATKLDLPGQPLKRSESDQTVTARGVHGLVSTRFSFPAPRLSRRRNLFDQTNSPSIAGFRVMVARVVT